MRFRPYLAACALSLPVFSLTAPAQAVSAQAEAPAGATSCAFSAWTNSEKPSIEVRETPSADAKLLGHIPTGSKVGEAEYAYSIGFDVLEAKDGWLKIANASDAYNEESDDYVPREVYKGEGWIKSDEAKVGIQSARGFLKPDPQSDRLLDIGSDWLTEMGRINNILACNEDWVLLDYTVLRKRMAGEELVELASDEQLTGRAWFRGLCSNAETTCDMKSVDQ
ncbi:hypothetical protein CQ052_17440 [Ochrobactrum sp. MYb15]|uniref:hypothetical protein n=1 Tax=Brucella pituitosa TaxID=571256 RepID=UPI000CFA9DD4|nr:hypothetical protein CQZ90_15000 [Ochrobactrum sp. MYb19]PRA54603.1 hypothetical protein CQ062_12810 [Ochrobactrum sp. MYb68]PRA64670.1 hypothetical protein CQ053_13525 [Ochrobactrum sp. MYb18]PRA75412.1 hypothetical protein CQ049_18160 [Brucella thiophenivorans]PRA89971.1 hypothetical protein CQ051_15440 [Ochrobactrum sp. MYb14]PRA97149.1 hypothetical protein CQ052_17440 [Ochrobactrum sp. MYb15]